MLRTLPPGPLDIVGDVHGERDALLSLLAVLGYDSLGHHPDGRHLVFVGDLVDRGPDSPGVVALVRAMVEAGHAHAVLGNHELNLLRGKRKAGADWFWGEGTHHDQRYEPFRRAEPLQDASLLAFFDTLPLVLQREDLRIVHAAWHAPAVAQLQTLAGPVSAGFAQLEDAVSARLDAQGLREAARAEKAPWRHHLHDPDIAVPMLQAVGQLDEARQMGNPIRVLTSGMERCTRQPFFAQQWRFAERVRWWDAYIDEVPVVVGHYWRQYLPLDRAALGKGDADLFEGVSPTAWLGPRGHVFCVDYSVGGRYKERAVPEGERRTRLAALQWPERVLVLETGERVETVGFGL